MMELDIVASIYYLMTRLRTDGGLGCYVLLTLAERITLALVCINITSGSGVPTLFPAVGDRSSGESK